MRPARVEAFTDGVLAIVITLMALELRDPRDETFRGLLPVASSVLTYLVSFFYIAVYWNNHHQLFQAARRINARVLWSNMLLLFFLSLIPFMTRQMEESTFSAVPTMLYGVTLLCVAIAWAILQSILMGENKGIRDCVGRDAKGLISICLLCVAIPIALLSPPVAIGAYVLVATVWFVPDHRFDSLTLEEPDGVQR